MTDHSRRAVRFPSSRETDKTDQTEQPRSASEPLVVVDDPVSPVTISVLLMEDERLSKAMLELILSDEKLSRKLSKMLSYGTESSVALSDRNRWNRLLMDRSGWHALEDYLEGMSMAFQFFPVDDTLDGLPSSEESWWGDWETIGRDMHIAMKQIANRVQEQQS